MTWGLQIAMGLTLRQIAPSMLRCLCLTLTSDLRLQRDKKIREFLCDYCKITMLICRQKVAIMYCISYLHHCPLVSDEGVEA